MRAVLWQVALWCLCGTFLAGCADDPQDSPEKMKAVFDQGLKDYDSGDYTGAYEQWKTIDDVDLAAMRNVALMLRKGQGVAKDPEAAQRKMEQAAEAGLVTAQADLADMLLKGEAGPPDPKAALPWLTRAAQAGHPIAAFKLGQLYEQGTVVRQDIAAARALYKLAAAAGLDEAAKRLAALPPDPAAPAKPPAVPPPAPKPPPALRGMVP